MPRTVLNNRRSRTSCSLFALATVLVVGASPASAQSLLGTGTYVTNPVAGGITTAPNTTNIALNGGNTVINWTPTDNAVGTGTNIVFQNAGTTANFNGAGNFAVLNRVMVADATRAIVMNGTVNALVGGSQQGSVYFYSPSGFIFGGGSVFNVGSLVVTTLPITDAAFSALGAGGFGQVEFGQALNANSAIVMNGTVNANNQSFGIPGPTSSSYVAMIAPKVVHSGTINVNGSAALVAAEAATINFSPDGLFDIQVTVGSTSSSGVEVYGDITGPTPTGTDDKQAIYLVAVPKNDAMTMVIGNGADLGFTLANTAVDDNGVIVLSAGHDIVDGQIGARSAGHGASATGNFWFTGAHATNNLFGEATGDANLYSVSPNLTTIFNNDVTVHAGNSVNMSVSGVGTTLTVGGDLNLSANRTGTAGQSVTAGDVHLYALNSGSLSVAGATSLTANATGGNASSGSAGNGTGGTIFVNTDDGGSLSLQALTASANGTGGNGTTANVNAGSGTGGTVSMYADIASGLVVNGATSLIAGGSGGNASGTGLAGNGTGGTARIYVGDNSSLTFNSNVGLVTNGTGGSSSGSSNGGTGTGGSSRITAVLGSSSGGLVTINGTASLSANGTGGFSNSGAGGDGIGGVTRMYSTAHHYVINGSASFSAVGDGGNSGSATGGTGLGGTAEIVSEGSEIDISGNVFLDSPGYGGGGLTGGDGLGGAVNIISENDISVAGDVLAFAEGEGAQGNGGNGGYGEGGVIDVTADGGVLSLGELTAVVFGRGGDNGGLGTTAGDGQGGSIFINALNGGGLSITNHVFAIAEAYGGRHGQNVTGGSGSGGYVELLASGTGSEINVGGNVSLNALAYGQFSDCFSCSGTGGDAFGGSVYVAADGADIAIGGNLLAEANAEGGDMDSGGTTGSGFGGVVTIRALTNGSLGITGSLTATADGLGGGNFGFGTNTGSGTGGDVFLQASGGNANITVGGYATVTANGEAGPFCGECGGGGLAGDGTGGSVTVQAFGASTSSLTINGSLDAEANGRGGDAISGNGGTGEGGSVYLGANDGADVHVLGSLSASAEGWGGYSYGPGDGGQGIGGSVTLAATTGGTLEIDGGGYIDADGYGGGAGISSSGDGGDGTGGVAGIYADGGAIDIGILLLASAEGHGGYSDNGAGGDGLGTTAEVFASNGGSVSIDGFLSLSVDGFGGTGITGGTGTGGGVPNEDGGGTDGAHIFARNGAVTVTGTTNLSSDGFGGSGASGGVGGSGTGGWATIHAANSDNGPSNITLAAVNISANATGGGGGQGLGGNQGGDGGAGGDAAAGTVSVLANAGNGHLLATNVSANAIATGGQGGDGGNGDNLAGGNGGTGGNAEGGFVTVGTASGNSQATGSNLGTATFTSIAADSSAAGGNGGAGNFGNSDGNGGAGGMGDGGSSLMLVRGSTVTVSGTTTLTSNGAGGDGGSGGGELGTQGDGGDGFAGEVHVLATSRFMIPAQQGTLNTGAIVGTAMGTGGDGAVDGAGIVEGGSSFVIDRSTANISSLDFTVGGEDVAPGSDPSRIAITNATVTVGTTFNFETIGDLSFYVDNGSMTAGTLAITANNFVFDPDSPAPSNLGTTYADNVHISTGNDFVANSNWDVTNTFVVDAPGLIRLDNVHDDNGIDFSAGSTINIATVDAGTYVDLLAGGSIATDDIGAGTTVRVQSTAGSIAFPTIDAGGNVTLLAGTSVSGMEVTSGGNLLARSFGGDLNFDNLESDGSMQLHSSEDILLSGDIDAGTSLTSLAGGLFDGNEIDAGTFIDIGTGGGISLGNLAAGDYIDLRSNGPISILNAISGETISFATEGSLTALNLTAGDSVLGQAMGAIDVGTVSAGIVNPSNVSGAEYRVRFASDANIDTGAVTAAGEIGFSTPGNLVTGNLDAGGGIMALIGGDISLPTVNAGDYVFLADHSMAALGGDFATFDRSAVLAAEPVLTGGAIAISGPLTASSFVTAAAGTNLDFTTLDAGGYVDLRAGANITGTSITAGSSISLHAVAGDIILGSATSSFASIMMDAGGDIDLSGDLFADGDILLTAAGLIDMNNATGGFFRADALGGTFTAGNITSDADIRIFADDDVTAGDLSAGLPVESSKALRIDTNGSVVVGNMVALGGIDVTADGSVTGLNVTTGDVLITEANGAITYGNISAGLVNPQTATEPASVVLDSATSIMVGNVDAAGTIGFITSGPLTAGNVTTGADLLGLVHGTIAMGDITADGRVLLADSSMFTDAGGAIGNFGDDEVDIESIFAATPVATNGSITIGDVDAGSFTAAAGTSLTTGIIDTDSEIGLGATGAITTGNLVAGDFVLANGGSITTGNIDADSVAMESTGGNITTGDIMAGGTVELDAFGNILTNNITAGTIDLAAGGSITTDDLTTELSLLLGQAQLVPDVEGNITLIAGGNILTGDISAVQNILLATPGMITGQTIDAGGIFLGLAHGDMSFGDASAAEVFLADYAMLSLGGGGGGGFSASCIGNCGTLGADGVVIASPSGLTYLYVTTDGGVSGAGQLPGEGGTNGSLYTTSAFSAGAGDDLEFWFNYVTSDGSGFADYSWASLLTADLMPVAILFTARTQPSGTIVPGQDLPGVEATLNPSTVPIIAGGPAWSPLGSSSGTCYSAGCGYTGWVSSTYEIATAGNYVLAFGVSNWSDTAYHSGMAFSGITVGGVPVQGAPIRTGGSISIGNVDTGSFTAAAGTELTTGIINSSGPISLDAGGAINTENLFAGTFVLANGGSVTTGNIDAGSVDMTSTDGNITTGNIVADGDVDLDASGNLSAQAITADDIEARASGTAIVNGAWNAGNVQLTSNDINITADASIDAADQLTLVSTNATQALIGDGLTGSGYALSDAEFGRLQGGSVHILARGDASAAQDMLIGNLTVAGPGAGGTIDSSEGILVFGVGDADSESVSGVIRVNGNVAATGFGSSNAIEFHADRFELNAATGSVSILSSGSTLGGELGIYADQIHVAAGSILDQLAVNPTYTNYQQDLNQPAAVQRPDGVLRADTLWIESDNLQSILIQNTGSGSAPAGFLFRESYINDDDEVAGPPGSINLVVNGQVVTESGTLTGVAARDALIDEETDITPFTSNSTINGCPLTGQCIIQPPQPPPTANLVENQIDLIGLNPIGENEFDDNQEGQEGSNNPIAPPQPLFDTRPLVPSGDVNDPVSGTGNPALTGGEAQCEEEEDGQCAAPVDGGNQ